MMLCHEEKIFFLLSVMAEYGVEVKISVVRK